MTQGTENNHEHLHNLLKLADEQRGQEYSYLLLQKHDVKHNEEKQLFMSHSFPSVKELGLNPNLSQVLHFTRSSTLMLQKQVSQPFQVSLVMVPGHYYDVGQSLEITGKPGETR